MRTYRDEAVVLRAIPLGEADRIVTLLTREHGKVRAVGKGVRRTGSRFGARLEPFMHVDVQLYIGRSLDVVTQAATLSTPARQIAGDYELYTTAAAMAEVVDRLVPAEKEPAYAQYRLLNAALQSLADRVHPADLTLDAYVLRAVATAGYAPSCWDCAQCGAPGPHAAFSIPSGGAVCENCRPPGSPNPGTAVLALMASLLSGDWQRADQSDRSSRLAASGLVAAFAQYHLERSLPALRLVERPA